MARGCGMLVGQSLAPYWTAEEYISGEISHSTLIHRLGWRENCSTYLRHFVRVEYPGWDERNFRFDEGSTLPGWLDNCKDEVEFMCNALLARIKPIYLEYRQAVTGVNPKTKKYLEARKIELEKYSSIKGFVPLLDGET